MRSINFKSHLFITCSISALVLLASTAFAHSVHKRLTLYGEAEKHGKLAMFLDLMSSVGYEETLRFRGPLTLYIPTDDALGEIPVEEMDRLLDDKEALQKFLQRHVVQGSVALKDMSNNKSITTVSGDTFEYKRDEKLWIGGVEIQAGNIRCTNGIIHVIKKVLPASEPQDEEVSNE